MIRIGDRVGVWRGNTSKVDLCEIFTGLIIMEMPYLLRQSANGNKTMEFATLTDLIARPERSKHGKI